MKNKKLLVIFLLSLSFCFVSGAGYGEVKEFLFKDKASQIQVTLLSARIDYMMRNPTSFLNVEFGHNPEFITLNIYDNRDIFYHKSGVALLDTFKKKLEVIYSFISHIATNMNTDVWAWFYSREGIELGYFLDGKYHLSED
jgi:hypothetical protein